MSVIRWEEPPPHGNSTQARGRPSSWGPFAPAGSFEAVGRKNGNGADVYARYIGGAR